MIEGLNQLPVKRDAVLHPPKMFLNRSSKNFWIFSNVDPGAFSWGMGVELGITVTVGGGVNVAVYVALGTVVGVDVGGDSR